MRFSNTIIIVFLVLSCAYEPDEVNYVELSPEIKPTVGVLLQDLPDTLLVFDVFQINYSFSIQNAPSFYTVATLGASSIHLAPNTATGSFLINPAEFPEGHHLLTFNIHTRSFTESLADRSGFEQIIFSKQVVVQIYKAAAEPANISSVEHRDGTVYVHWPAYPRLNLRKYVLEITRYNPAPWSNDPVYQRNINVSPDATFVQDSSALGHKTRYRLYTYNTVGDVAAGEYFTDSEKTLPQITGFETINTSEVKVTWAASRYYNNINSYKVTTYPINETSDLTDTTVYLKSQYFGTTFSFHLFMKSRFDYQVSAGIANATRVYMGKKIDKAYHYAFSAGSSTTYFVSGNYFGKLDDSGNKLDSVEVTWTNPVAGLSRNNSHAFVGTTFNLWEIDPQTLEKKSWISIGGYNTGGAYSPVVTNDNHLCFIHYYSVYSYDVGAQMAPDTINRLTFSKPLNLRLSPNEAMLIENGIDGVRLLTIENKRFVSDEYLGFENYQGYFVTGDNTNVYLTNGSEIRLLNVTSRGVTLLANLPYSFHTQLYDVKKDWIAGIDALKKHLVVYDIKTGALIMKLPYPPYIDPSAFSIHDGKIYSNEGYWLDIN